MVTENNNVLMLEMLLKSDQPENDSYLHLLSSRKKRKRGSKTECLCQEIFTKRFLRLKRNSFTFMSENKKKLIVAIIIAGLLTTAVKIQSVNVAKGNFIAYCPVFVINSDGTITPPTILVERNGERYYLTSDTSNCSFAINCSNIIFDGQGHTISGYINRYWGYSNDGLSLDEVQNVTIKDVTLYDFRGESIILRNCSNCVLLNVHADWSVGLSGCFDNKISECSLGELSLGDSSTANSVTGNQLERLAITGNNNTIYGNNVTNLYPYDGYDNLFYDNNFYAHSLNYMNANFWNNGSVGNFWFDYATKYPNATEIGNTGIGNTPYVIDENNTDYFPLIFPTEISTTNSTPSPTPTPTPTATPAPTASPKATPSQTPTPTPTATPTATATPKTSPQATATPTATNGFPMEYVYIIIAVVVIAIVAAIAYFYLKRGK
jgi:hypothetical protein